MSNVNYMIFFTDKRNATNEGSDDCEITIEISRNSHHITVFKKLHYKGHNIPSNITKVLYVRNHQYDLQDITQ